MNRGRAILALSHCILNQNACACGRAREKGAFHFVRRLPESGIGIIQMPCPGLRWMGADREDPGKELLENDKYRELCKSIADWCAAEIAEYVDKGYLFYGVMGVAGSYSCGWTIRKGVFMEELQNALTRRDVDCNWYEVPGVGELPKDWLPIPEMKPPGLYF